MSEQVINGLKPEILWKRFYEITKVPRPSKKEEKILKHFKELFATLNVAFKQGMRECSGCYSAGAC
jgi:dipeptidase D